MLFRKRNERIRKIGGSTVNITLDETLRPLWKLTFYCGVLLDWCLPASNNSRLCRVLRCIGIFISSSLLFAMLLFELTQLLVGIESASNIHAIIPNLLWSVPIFIAFAVQLYSLRQRRKFLSFFKKWRQLEMEIAHLNPHRVMCESRKMHVMMYVTYGFMTMASLFSLGLDIFNRPEATYLMSTYQTVRETIPLLLIGTIHLMSILLIWILSSLADFIPAFTYYHASLAVSCLENEVRTLFAERNYADDLLHHSISSRLSLAVTRLDSFPVKQSNLKPAAIELEESVRLIWTRFEAIDEMVSRADSLFGSFMVYGQAGAIFFTTALVYSVLYNLSDALQLRSAGPVLSYSMNLIAIVFRFVSSLIISSHLHRSTGKFRASLTYLLSKHWNRMTKEDRELFRSFLWRLQIDPLVARPLGVYCITPSVLLSVFGVIVSYVIVLLQTK